MDKDEKQALKEKKKQERKELRKARKIQRENAFAETIDENPLKFKEWFSL